MAAQKMWMIIILPFCLFLKKKMKQKRAEHKALISGKGALQVPDLGRDHLYVPRAGPEDPASVGLKEALWVQT